jgi:hypothetical protein
LNVKHIHFADAKGPNPTHSLFNNSQQYAKVLCNTASSALEAAVGDVGTMEVLLEVDELSATSKLLSCAAKSINLSYHEVKTAPYIIHYDINVFSNDAIFSALLGKLSCHFR